MLKRPRKYRFYLIAAILALSLPITYGIVSINSDHKNDKNAKSISVSIIQPNISPEDKTNPSLRHDNIDKHITFTEKSIAKRQADLVLWPETAIIDDFISDDISYYKVAAAVRKANTHFLLGAALSKEGKDHNSAVLMRPDATVSAIYDKQYLVPFSEYPFWKEVLGPLYEKFNIEYYDFYPGNKKGLFQIDNIYEPGEESFRKFGVSICSEDFYPLLFREFSSQKANFAVVILNDGWFRHDQALMMHAQSSIMRAVENKLPIIRAANTGFSCLVNKHGEIALDDTLPLNKSASNLVSIQLSNERTFYGKYGYIFPLLCLFFVIISFSIYLLKKFFSKKDKK